MILFNNRLTIMKDLVRIISNSNLDDSQKESLKAGVVVGYTSSKLWKDGKD